MDVEERRMLLAVTITDGNKFLDTDGHPRFFSHLLRDSLRRTVQDVAPSPGQRPALVGSFLHE